MNLELNPNKIKNIETDIVLPAIQVDEVNIYNQAYLTIDTPLIKTNIAREKANNELMISFPLAGELKGMVHCFIDTYKKALPESEMNYLKNLFSESMNILIGKMLTNIERSNDYHVILGSPIKDNNIKFGNYIQNKEFDVYNVGYKLIYNALEYDCRLLFFLNKTKHIEV